MDNSHYNKSISFFGNLILDELKNENKICHFRELMDMGTADLISYEKTLKGKPQRKKAKFIMAARRELTKRNMVWDSEKETWD